ncbi:MAG: hypothetical protein H6740_28515 [Alphaproteobacteria bacterium]|nr:hypothetical protein [Alphaproteobacteria bacterium]
MTRCLALSLLTLTLGACSGGAVNQGRDIDWNNADSGSSDDTAPTGDDSAEGDSDTDSDADSDTDSDTDIQWEGACGNYWDPIDLAGWTKNYDVMYNGSPGTEVQAGQGESYGGRYRFDTTLTVQDGTGWSGYVQVACGYGNDEGLFILDWNVDYSSGVLSGGVETTHSAPRKYLPDESVLGRVGSWDYAYTMQTYLSMGDTAAPLEYPVEVNGTYVERGEVEVTLNGTTFTGYHLVNTYTMTSESFLGAFTREGTIDQVWVKGVGLVTESHQARLDTGETTDIQKTLTTFTGLEPIP